MELKDFARSGLIAGSLLFGGCSSVFVVPIATIDNILVYPYNERKNGQVVAQGLSIAPKGVTLRGFISQIFIDGGSRISPSTPDGIVDEYIVVSPSVGKFVYTRSSYIGPDGVSHDLNDGSEEAGKLRDITQRTLDAATKEYQRYRSLLSYIGK